MHMKREMGKVMTIRKTEMMVRSTESDTFKIFFDNELNAKRTRASAVNPLIFFNQRPSWSWPPLSIAIAFLKQALWWARWFSLNSDHHGCLASLPFLNDSDIADRRHSSITSPHPRLFCQYWPCCWGALTVSEKLLSSAQIFISRSPWLSVFTNLLRRICSAVHLTIPWLMTFIF